MGFYGNKSLHCFLVTWIQLLSSAGWLRLVGTTNLKRGHVNKWPSDIKRPKTPLSDHIKGFHFLTMPTMKKHVTQVHLHGTLITSPFPYLQGPSSTPKTTLLLYPINISSPSPSGRQIWDLFSHLIVWLPCEWMNFPAANLSILVSGLLCI